jgi:hypothetical protein
MSKCILARKLPLGPQQLKCEGTARTYFIRYYSSDEISSIVQVLGFVHSSLIIKPPATSHVAKPQDYLDGFNVHIVDFTNDPSFKVQNMKKSLWESYEICHVHSPLRNNKNCDFLSLFKTNIP